MPSKKEAAKQISDLKKSDDKESATTRLEEDNELKFRLMLTADDRNLLRAMRIKID